MLNKVKWFTKFSFRLIFYKYKVNDLYLISIKNCFSYEKENFVKSNYWNKVFNQKLFFFVAEEKLNLIINKDAWSQQKKQYLFIQIIIFAQFSNLLLF